jgi:hypothetical protein
VPDRHRGVVLGRPQAKGKITRDGVFLEQLERDPAHYLPEPTATRSSAASA